MHEQNERRDGRVVWAFACAARFTAMIRSAVVTRVRSLAARGLAAGLLAAVAALLALPLQAVTLVNNLSEPTTSTPSVGGASNFRQAQKFTVPTGQDYSLDDVTIGVGFRGNDGIVVSIRDGSAADPPGTALYTLIDPVSPGTGNQTYSAPAGAVLEGGNNYFVMLERAQNSGGSSTVRGTDDDGQSGETGWLIDDVRRKRSSGTWSDDTHALKIRIRGDVYTPSTDATLSDLELEGATGGEVISLSPAFDSATETYTASVANRIDAVTLTATKNDTTATVAITNDDDTNTQRKADLDLNVGSNTLTVTVTPESATAKTYTITVTRAAAPPAPTDCPADTDWCTTLGVGYATDSTASFKIENWGYQSDRSYGDLLSTTFSHSGTSYTVPRVSRTKITQLPGNTVTSDNINLYINQALPDGTVLQLGSRTFTVDTDSSTSTIGQEQWDIRGNPLIWTAGQHVTASLKFPTAPDQPTGLTATASGATQIDLAWVAPADNGGAAISGYRIEVSADAGTTWTNLLANTGATSVTYSHTGLTRGSTRHYRVSAINANGTGAASDPTSATTAAPTPPAPPEITVPHDWSLIPTGLSSGDKFRLIFLSSTKTNAGSADIVDYNTFIQNRAAAGHSDIQTYSAGFRAVGCTADSDATANTATTGTGVVIHWLNGNKVADDYADFYDGSWDDEANDKEEDGTDGPNTTIAGNFPWTGCEHNGTEATFAGDSRALGAGTVRIGRPNSSVSNNGPLSSANNHSSSGRRLMYGLSQVFEVAAAGNAAATGTPSIDGTPQVGMVLTAAKGNLADADGTTKADNGDTGYAYSYQWVRVDGGTQTPITGATAITYTPVAADVGKKVKVTVNFTDDGGTGEARTSNAFPASGTITAEPLPVLSISGITVDEDAGSATLTVEFTPASTGTVTVDYATRDQVGGATAGEDYTATSGTLTFTAGQTSKTITVPITDDDVYENYEAFFVDLSNPSGATLPVHPTVAVGIDSEDAVPTASMADVTVDEGAGTMTLTLRLSHLSHEDIAYSTVDTRVTGTATEGDDYDDFLLGPPAGTARITVPAGSLSQTFDITVVDDGVDEADETIVILWQKVTGDDVTPTTFTFTGTIVPVPLPALSFASNEVTVDEDAGSATHTVELTPASTGTVTVDYATRDRLGDAIAGEDYTATSGTLTFAATETSKTITVPITDDDVYENALEVFYVDLSNPTGATLPDPPSAGIGINSEDAVPTASMADVTVDEGAGTMTLTLRLSHPSHEDIAYVTRVVDVTGTATEGDDYDDFLLGPAGTARITVPGGDLSQTFDITLVDDGVDEPDETIIILWQKSTSDEVTPVAINFTGTIVPEPLPALSFVPNEVTVDEDAGPATLTVELTPASIGTVTVDYATRDSFAKAGEDYTATSGTLTFTAGQTSKTITVPITDDDVYEAAGATGEIFFIDITNPTGATLPDPPLAAVRIDSEEAAPTASMADVTVDEGAGTMTLTLRLSHPSQRDIAYLTIYDEDYDTGTATEGDDYDDFLLETGRTAKITVPARSLSQTFDITVVDDGVDEPDETIVIEWIRNSNDDATPDFITFTGTITDNDTADNNPPVFTDGASTSRAFNETLGDAAVITALDIGTAVGATDADADTLAYSLEGADAARFGIIPTTGQLRTRAGEKYDYEAQSSYTVRIRVVDGNGGADTIDVTVNVTNNTGETPLAPAQPTVTTTPGSMTGLDVFWVAPDNTGRPIITGYDLGYREEGVTSWTEGPQDVSGTSASIAGLTADTSYEVGVRALNEDGDGDWSPSGSARTGAPPTPTVRFGATSYTAIEGVGGATVTVALSVAAARSVTVRLTKTHLGGATSADYAGVPSSVTFAAGETEKTFIVTAVDDTADDDGESVQLGFDTLPAGVVLGSPSTATVALVQDADVSTWYVWFGASAYTATEGGTARITVHLNAPWKPERNEALTVPLFDPQHQGGASADDYSGVPESVTFQPGQTQASFTVRVTDDSDDDDGESVLLAFRRLFPDDLEVGRYGPGSTTLRIDDNDGETAVTVSFEAANYTAVEGGATATVRLRLDAAPGRTVTIPLTKTHREATAADYSGAPGSVTFGATETEQSFTVTATDDTEDDDLESVLIRFGSLPARVSAGSPSEAVVNLTDNDGGVEMLTVRFGVRAGVQLDGVEEGGGYRLGFRLDKKPGRKLTIPLTYTYLGGATAADFEDLPAAVTFGKNATSAGVTVRPVDDFDEDPGESLKVSFGTLPAGVQVSSLSGPSVIIPVIDNDAQPGLSVSDASAREWPNKKVCLLFQVTMDLMDVDHEVSVDYATANGTAVAGQDFKPISGTLVFRPSESRRRTASKSLCVEVIDDSHDEGVEEMTLVLSNPVRAYLADGTGTGSISNTDKMPGAWLTRFGRAATDHVVEAVGERWQGEPQTPHLTLGGRQAGDLFGWAGLGGRTGRDTAVDRDDPVGTDPSSMGWLAPSGAAGAGIGATAPGMTLSDMNTAPGGTDGVEREAGKTLSGRAAQGALLRALGLPDPRAVPDLRTLLMGSSFFYSAALDEDGESRSPGRTRSPGWLGEWSAWGRTAASRFSGADGNLTLDGEVATAMLGFDSRWGRWLAGVVVSFSEGQGAYTHPTASGGAVESTMTGLNPYARFELNERTSFWGVLGYGAGDLSLTPARSDTALGTKLENAMAAFGGRTALSVRTGEAGRFELAVRSDARLTNTVSESIEGLVGTAGQTGRARLMLEGSGSMRLASGAVLKPKLEAGLRYDTGDAETGAGLEVGGGLGYAAGRLSVEGNARGLLVHRDTKYEEWGFSGSIAYTPSKDGRGLSMRLGSAWGAPQSGVQSLWSQQDASGLVRNAAFEAAQRYQVELRYGLDGKKGRARWEPFVGVESGEGASRALRLGVKLTSGRHLDAGLELGQRQGRPGADPEQAVQLRGAFRW